MKIYHKNIVVTILLIGLGSFLSLGQHQESLVQTHEAAIKATIDQLFDAMRQEDSIIARQIFMEGATLSSIYTSDTDKVLKNTSPASIFIQAIGQPRQAVWDERIWSYDINIDYPMAIAWTEYTFYLDDRLMHCGVNVFELLHIDQQWIISSIADTRRTKPCREDAYKEVNRLMDGWHQAAAVADEDVFWGSMTQDAIYLGTDINERWTAKDMSEWAQPYFDRESAWSFTPKNRKITFDSDHRIGWLDEELDTWMGSCRGSAVVIRTTEGWKIKHYHLAIAVPNDSVDDYLKLIDKPTIKRGE